MEKNLFDEIYKEYNSRIVAFFNKRINNEHDSEEMASDVFTNFYKSIENFDEKRCSVATWLFVIANNRLKNYYAAKKELVSIEENELDFADNNEIETAVALEESRSELLEAVHKLSERERIIIIQRFYMDKSCEEVADYLNITSGNVRVIQKRALEKLKKNISRRFL